MGRHTLQKVLVMKILLPAFAAILAVPAFAQVTTPPPATSAVDAADIEDASQNRIICKTVKSTGSRLRGEKVCMTKAQWAQKQQEERQVTERSQNQRQTY